MAGERPLVVRRVCFDGDGVATGVGAGGGALTGAMSDSVRDVRSIAQWWQRQGCELGVAADAR